MTYFYYNIHYYNIHLYYKSIFEFEFEFINWHSLKWAFQWQFTWIFRRNYELSTIYIYNNLIKIITRTKIILYIMVYELN
jgi:hypothetical protein